MRAAKRILLFVFAALTQLCAAGADNCPVVIPVSDAGWYTPANFHDPDNNNYTAGYHAAGAIELRNFFVFDLPIFSAPVLSAELRIFTFTISTSQASEEFQLHHVNTPVTSLVAATGPELTNIFNDLGEG